MKDRGSFSPRQGFFVASFVVEFGRLSRLSLRRGLRRSLGGNNMRVLACLFYKESDYSTEGQGWLVGSSRREGGKVGLGVIVGSFEAKYLLHDMARSI